MLVLQIDQSSIIALIGLLGTVLPVGISYVLTKNKEIDASIRQEKTERYDNLIDALVMIARSKPDDDDALNNFNTAYNRAMAYANDCVLERCNDLHAWILEQKLLENQNHLEKADMGQLRTQRNALINGISKAIRLDINPKAKYFRTLALISFGKDRATK